MRRLISGLLVVLGCAVAVRGVAAQGTPDGLGALIRQLMFDTMRDGGARDDMVLVAADSASAVLLRLADVHPEAAPGPKGLACPASTEADGRNVPPPVGYVVEVAITSGADTTTRELRITKSCAMRYRGSYRGFAEGGAWALRRDGDHWVIKTTLYLWVT